MALTAIMVSGCRAMPSSAPSPPRSPSPGASSSPRESSSFAACVVRLEGDAPVEVHDCLSMRAGELRVSDGLLKRLKPDAEDLVDLWSLQFHDPENAPRGIAKSFGAWATRDGRALVVPTFDNGADYFSEGLVRFVASSGKIGFANRKLAIVIPATFDWATPFESGRSNVCHGCVAVREPGDGDAHWKIEGGTHEVIDTAGHVVDAR